MRKYKVLGTTPLFLEDYRLDKLSKQGDPLERLNKIIEWEYFRETIEKVHRKKWSMQVQNPMTHY